MKSLVSTILLIALLLVPLSSCEKAESDLEDNPAVTDAPLTDAPSPETPDLDEQEIVAVFDVTDYTLVLSPSLSSSAINVAKSLPAGGRCHR